MRVAIAGASGFVGQILLKSLSQEFDLVALGRSIPSKGLSANAQDRTSIEWKNCDLFSLIQTEDALQGVEVGIYLVHSMLPRARLTQSTFEDCDLILADNFARAAQKAGVKRIVYLGGLLPETRVLSRHLESRREVEQALSGRGAAVTNLRAGMILGAEGSSFQMLYLLVKRLPVMVCPDWTRTRTQCIGASDVAELIRFTLKHPETESRTYDLGNPEVVTYQQLMKTLAQEMGQSPRFLSVPFFTPGLSRLWVQLITGGSKNLISPLIQSLRHEMLVRDATLLELYGKPLLSIRESMRICLDHIRPTLRSSTRLRFRQLRNTSDVRSIQRLPLPQSQTAEWVALEYFNWLPRHLAPLIKVTREVGDRFAFRLVGLGTPLLVLTYSAARSSTDRQLYFITGGVLAGSRQSSHARLEFREVLAKKYCLAAIHDYRPSLPWLIYKYSQALIHLWVMTSFRKHLRAKRAE